MKQIAILAVFCFYSILTFSQEAASINVGVGLPSFLQPNFDDNSGGNHSINSGSIHVFSEIQQLIKFKNSPSFSVTPGIGYFLFNESESGGGLGGGNSSDVKHSALSVYAKLNYSITQNKEKPFRWYGGVLLGFYLYSKTSGERSWWMMEQLGGRSGSAEIDKSGKPFFNSFYNGIYAGFKIKAGKSDRFQPAFEFSFLPGYANITDKFLSNEDKDESLAKSMIMGSVIFGFGTKKATRINE